MHKLTEPKLRQIIREELMREVEKDKEKKNPYLVKGDISGTYLEKWQTLRHLIDGIQQLYAGSGEPDDWMEGALMAIHDDDPAAAKQVKASIEKAADALSKLRGSYDWGALPASVDPTAREMGVKGK